MAFSHSLASRVRACLGAAAGITEKRMFGGITFLVRGNLCVCVWNDSLVVRVGPDRYHAALEQEFVREFDATGRPMTGWVLVTPDGLDTDRDLAGWVDAGLQFAGALPAKAARTSPRKPRNKKP